MGLIAAVTILAFASAQPAQGQELPSLDELLGLTAPGQRPADASRARLERSLRPQEPQDAMGRVAEMMDEAAQRLEQASDVGLATQRTQEEILRRLDALIAQASNQQQSSSSRSSSGEPVPPAPPNQRSVSGQQGQAGAQAAGSSAQGGAADAQSGELKPPSAAAAAAWGQLPENIRQALMQGFSDRFSSLYQAQTQEYYKRLAQESSAKEGAP